MHYIIDGYNLFFRLEEEITPLAEKREEFVEFLIKEMTRCHIKANLIFDSGKTHKNPFPSTKEQQGLTITFSPYGISADTYILEFLKYQKLPQTMTLVTSDRELAKKARELGAITQTIEAFLKMLQAKKKRRGKSEDKKELKDSNKNIARLQSIFEEKLRQETSD